MKIYSYTENIYKAVRARIVIDDELFLTAFDKLLINLINQRNKHLSSK